MARILLENITHRYQGEVLAVKDVNWEIPDGSVTALLGPSGCGKTTLMKIISGLLEPTEGSVYYDEENVTELTPQKREVSMVFQFPVVYGMSVRDNLRFPLRGEGYSENEIKEKVQRTADLLGISGVLDKSARSLSPALKQITSIGRAVIREDINAILLDEPLSDVEPESKWEVKKVLKQIQEEIEESVIYVTHDQSEAMTFANKIAIMNQGEMVQYDSEKKLFEEPKNEFVGNFIGSPGMNFIEFSMQNSKMNFGSFSLEAPDELKSRMKERKEKLRLGIKPEHIQVTQSKESEDFVPFECVLIEDEGYRKVLTLKNGNQEIKATIGEFEVSEGEDVYCRLPSSKILLFDTEGNRLSA